MSLLRLFFAPLTPSSSSPLLRFISSLAPSSLRPSPRSDPTRFHCMHVYIFTCTRVRYASNHALDSWLPCSQDSDNVCASRSASTTRCVYSIKKGIEKVSGRAREYRLLSFFLPFASLFRWKKPLFRLLNRLFQLINSRVRRRGGY